MKMPLTIMILSILSLVTTVSTSNVSAQNMTEACADNGKIAPCIDEHGHLVYYCDDPKSKKGTMCMPSPKQWADFLPSCDSVNYKQSCGIDGPYFSCNDPEFDIRKYPYGCIGIEEKQTGDSNNNNNGGSDSNKNKDSNDNSNNKDGKITVAYGDVGSYYGKGKVVIKNLDTGQTLVTHDLHFGKQHDSQGKNCCVKTYPFDDDRTHNGDRIFYKVTGGGGSWEGTDTYKNNFRMSISLEEIGEDVDGNQLYGKNNNKKDNSDEFICDSDPETTAPSCADYEGDECPSDADFCGPDYTPNENKDNDNNDNNDWSKGNDNDNDNNEEEDYDVEEEPPAEEEDFEPEGNLSG